MATKRIVLVLGLIGIWLLAPYDWEAAVLLHPDTVSGWSPTVHIPSNAWFLSCPDVLSGLLSPPLAFKLHVALLFAGLVAGCGLPIMHSALVSAVLVSWFGRDPLVIPALSLTPWLLWSLDRNIILALVISCTLAGCAQTQSLFVALFTFITAATRAQGAERSAWVRLAICAVPAIVVLSFMPTLPFPSYPRDAHLVPDDGVPGIIRPLLGPALPIPVIARDGVKAYLAEPALAVLLCLGAFAICRVKLGVITLAFAFSIFADIRLHDHWAVIGPLQALGRIIPGFFLVPTAFISVGAALVLLALSSPRAGGRSYFATAACLACLLFVQTSKPQNPVFHDDAKKIFASPSLYILRNGGAELLGREERIRKAVFTGPRRKETVIVSNPPPADPHAFRVLLDRRADDRRWSPSKGKQEGNEWIHVSLPGLRSVDGIELDPGAFASDFPRGLEVAVSTTCGDLVKFSDYSTVARFPHWQGAIQFTPDGYPYFAGQHEVEVVFPETKKARCLLIRQIGSEQRFDWSVSELRLLLGGNEPEQSD